MLEYKSITCELDSIIEELFKQQRMIRALFNQEIDCIVVGRQMFDMLNQAIFLQFPHGYSVHYGNQQVSLGGMPLVLVPWFKGVLALPKKSN